MTTFHYNNTPLPVGNPVSMDGSHKSYELGLYDGADYGEQYADEPECGVSALFANFGNCAVCGQVVTGSHYHCSCGGTDTTGMYGHHGTRCKVTGKNEKFHHCGPDGNCDLGDIA